ncbi:hypothetical protein BvRS1_21280 [Burkholderia vietnamiensis]|nr:hypothetical protein BvRS1_21280 [Burkholderia vietnamiensis]
MTDSDRGDIVASNRQQQCTSVAPPNRRILLHAPLLLLLVASGSCLAGAGAASALGAREIPEADAGGGRAALPPDMQPAGTTVQGVQVADAEPPTAPTPIARASDASMQVAQAPQASRLQASARPTTVVVEPDTSPPSEPRAVEPALAAPVRSMDAVGTSDAASADTMPDTTPAAEHTPDGSLHSSPGAAESMSSVSSMSSPPSPPATPPPRTPTPAPPTSAFALPEPTTPAQPTPATPQLLAQAAPPAAPTRTAPASAPPLPDAPTLRPPGAQPSTHDAPNSQSPGPPPPGDPPPRTQGPDVEAPNAQAPNLRTAHVATVRNDVFGLAAGGGAVKALEEAKARPDAFSAVDGAQLEELSIRQQVRGGRDKSRSMTSADRFDGIDDALRAADDLDQRMPPTPEYSPVRTALAGDRTIAHAARGDMKTAVATFETIPSNAEISIDAPAAVGDAYLYLSEPAKAHAVYERALKQATASPTDRATRGFQYGARTRAIELREGLFWSYVDQGRAADAGKVLDDMRTSLPPAKEVRNYGPEESDYLRYYRLRAQYLIVTGHVDEGIAALEQLAKEVPFNAEIRAAHADAVSGQSHPRQAISMYRASLTDHPDSVEMLAGLGRAALAADDYASAKYADQTLGNTFPDSGAVRSFKRDYNAYRSPVFTTELSYEHGNSALADNSFTSDSYLYSQPFGDNWRVFSHTFFGYAQTDAGRISRTRTGVGGDYRHGPLTVQAEATRPPGTDGRTGGRGTIAYALNDYWTVSGALDSNDNSLPWKAYAAHIWGRPANVAVVYRQNDRREVRLSYGGNRYSDSNLHQEIAASATQRV